jgi:16S rRNA (uracil1498-N3)-methyltransferase
MRREPSHDFVFYFPDLDHDSQSVDLTDDEHHHLSRVLRASTGDEVFVSNGRGMIVACAVDAIERHLTRVKVGRTVEDRAGEQPLTLALACLRKDAFEHAVKQCTELGVTHFLPFVAAKSHLKAYTRQYLDRLRRIGLSAMKQSFRSFLPTIDEAISFDALLDRAAQSPSVLVADADAPAIDVRPRPRPIMIVVGPEGGLTQDERARLESLGCESASVSAYRLRSETAAAAFTGLVGVSGSDGNSIDSL